MNVLSEVLIRMMIKNAFKSLYRIEALLDVKQPLRAVKEVKHLAKYLYGAAGFKVEDEEQPAAQDVQ